MLDFLVHILSVLRYAILPFLFILGFCITIHELGHFIFAKLAKIPVEKFSIGFGPALLRMQIGETDFRIAYFPLGGYVKMAGEDEGEIVQKETNKTTDVPGFYDAPIWKRIAVVFCGPLFNIISAFFILLIIIVSYGIMTTPFMKISVDVPSYYHTLGFVTDDSIVAVNGHQVMNWEEVWDIAESSHDQVLVTVMRDGELKEIEAQIYADSGGWLPQVPAIAGAVKHQSPADKAGIKQGDRIVSIDGHEVSSWNEMVDIVRTSESSTLQITWLHKGETTAASITPESLYDELEQDTIRQIGIFMPHGRTWVSFWSAVVLAVEQTKQLIYRILMILYQLVTRQIPARQLGGPIAIFRLGAESAQWGFSYLLSLLAIISVNLGLINLFPLPALDGGHIIIGVIEAIRKRRFSQQTRATIQYIGYAVIFMLIIFVTFNDITR